MDVFILSATGGRKGSWGMEGRWRPIQLASLGETGAQGGRELHRLTGVRHCGAHSLIKQLVELLFSEGPRLGGPPDTSPPPSEQSACASRSG